jgi:hypothetical protein
VDLHRLEAGCRCVVLGACLLAGSASAGTIRHDRSDQLYLDLAQEPQYASVGQILIGGYQGSGTLVAGRWVLTAAHVVENGSAAQFGFEIDDQTYGATQILVHPEWAGVLEDSGDLAMVMLDRVVPGIAPATLYTGRDEVDQVTTVVGFGRTGTGLTGDVLPGGEKRAGQNLIGGLGDVVGYSVKSILADFDDPDPSATGLGVCLDLEYLTAPGDSGGGWFIEDGGQHVLVGVTSYGFAQDEAIDSDYNDAMGATRVSDYLGWVQPLLNRATPGDNDGDGDIDDADLGAAFANYTGPVGSAGNKTALEGDTDGDGDVDDADLGTAFAAYTGPIGTASVPEPTSLGPLGLGVLALVRRRRVSAVARAGAG